MQPIGDDIAGDGIVAIDIRAEGQVKNAQLGLVSGELGNYNAALIHILEAMA